MGEKRELFVGSGASSWSVHGPHPTPTPPLPENRELWGGLPASVLLPPSWWNLSFTRPGVQLPPHFSDPLGPLGRPSAEMAAYFLPFTLHCSISSPEGKACLGYSHLPVLKQDLAHSRCLINTGRLPSEPAGPPSPAPVLTRATWTVNSTPMPTDATRITTGMALSLMPRKPMMPKSSTVIIARTSTWGGQGSPRAPGQGRVGELWVSPAAPHKDLR